MQNKAYCREREYRFPVTVYVKFVPIFNGYVHPK
jgi:hypothetical protein